LDAAMRARFLHGGFFTKQTFFVFTRTRFPHLEHAMVFNTGKNAWLDRYVVV
jgi:hypothetical protein